MRWRETTKPETTSISVVAVANVPQEDVLNGKQVCLPNAEFSGGFKLTNFAVKSECSEPQSATANPPVITDLLYALLNTI